jgi:alcohol dehydrogenase class IV
MVVEPHGVCLAACTNIGLKYNLSACEKDFAVLAGIMSEIDKTSPSTVSAETFVENMLDLAKDLGFPSRPSEVGLKKGDAEKLLKNTLVQTRRTKTNPRDLDDELLSHIEEGF